MIRELLTRRERQAAAAIVILWGYPRRIETAELDHARWWETEHGIGWLIPGKAIPGVPDDHCHMHGIGRPGSRRAITRELTDLVVATAREMGATRVVQPLVGEEYTALRRLWARAGWSKLDSLGCPYMEIT